MLSSLFHFQNKILFPSYFTFYYNIYVLLLYIVSPQFSLNKNIFTLLIVLQMFEFWKNAFLFSCFLDCTLITNLCENLIKNSKEIISNWISRCQWWCCLEMVVLHSWSHKNCIDIDVEDDRKSCTFYSCLKTVITYKKFSIKFWYKAIRLFLYQRIQFQTIWFLM